MAPQFHANVSPTMFDTTETGTVLSGIWPSTTDDFFHTRVLPDNRTVILAASRTYSLTVFEVEDVLESRRERARGETRRFSTSEDLFAWLDSE